MRIHKDSIKHFKFVTLFIHNVQEYLAFSHFALEIESWGIKER